MNDIYLHHSIVFLLLIKVLFAPLTANLLEKLSFSKYKLAVLQRAITILGIILLAVGLVVEVVVLWRDNL